MKPIAALPLQIFAYAISPYDDWHRQAWAGALVLVGFIFALNVIRALSDARKTCQSLITGPVSCTSHAKDSNRP